jgi:aspartate-semialdehyde dehydrogenase
MITSNLNLKNVGIVGATGVVGETFLNLLEERDFPAGEIRLFASEASLGQTRRCFEKDIPIQTLSEGCFDGLDLVFFSSGDDISEKWAPLAVKAGAFAVDNSAAFRMKPEFPLMVPEVNDDLLAELKSPLRPTIIANPNCSTIQLVVALNPLAQRYGLKSVRVASYQSVSGAGRYGIEELHSETLRSLNGDDLTDAPANGKTFPAPIAFNCIPQIGSFDANGFCSEEIKIMNETRKILRLPDLHVSAFTVRVPTMNCHAEAVWVTLDKSPTSAAEVEACLGSGQGLEVSQSLAPGAVSGQIAPNYPTQLTVSGRDPVYVGRIHRDYYDPSTWLMWVVSDNLRKGAALNGIQIAERIFDLK